MAPLTAPEDAAREALRRAYPGDAAVAERGWPKLAQQIKLAMAHERKRLTMLLGAQEDDVARDEAVRAATLVSSSKCRPPWGAYAARGAPLTPRQRAHAARLLVCPLGQHSRSCDVLTNVIREAETHERERLAGLLRAAGLPMPRRWLLSPEPATVDG